ncbi:T9SS type A sorting domain-containing protein [Hymenobacter terrenus]|uniref:T9SS type A sorting domain-containing protein n=1 Tax=Hymenobacter terrenus TaxID=1629124 RepID=UPI0006194613|nr:T9SS type A sorting domain-containing protein [Hymenobacter terrenus]
MPSYLRASSLALLIALPLLVRSGARAQAPAWQTAVAVPAGNNTSSSSVAATATDASGNVYVTGFFAGTISLGSTALTSVGSTDIFVAKWSPATGSFVWAQRAGGSGPDVATALAINGANVYVAGQFESGTATFGSEVLTNAGSRDAFVTKLSDAGNSADFVWAQRAGGANSDVASALAVSGANVYLAGHFFSASADFGSTTIATVGSADVFVAKLTDAGPSAVFTWVQRAGGTSYDEAAAIDVTGASLYVTGAFSGPTGIFGSITLNASTTSSGDTDAFVAKLTDAGTTGFFSWVQRAGGAGGNDFAEAVAVRGNSVYVAGEFRSPSAAFGASLLSDAGIGPDAGDMFVTKLTDAGSFLWAQRAGGVGADKANALAVNGSDVYVAGQFSSPSADFGASTLLNTGGDDSFVVKLADAGASSSFAWAQPAGGRGRDAARAIAVSSTGVYVAGDFSGPSASFGSLTLSNGNLTEALGFVAVLPLTTPLATSQLIRMSGLALWPNPARGQALLRLPALPVAAPVTLMLTNALGQTLRTQTVASSAGGAPLNVPLTGLVPGLYYLHVAAGDQHGNCPLVVE